MCSIHVRGSMDKRLKALWKQFPTSFRGGRPESERKRRARISIQLQTRCLGGVGHDCGHFIRCNFTHVVWTVFGIASPLSMRDRLGCEGSPRVSWLVRSGPDVQNNNELALWRGLLAHGHFLTPLFYARYRTRVVDASPFVRLSCWTQGMNLCNTEQDPEQ